MVIIITVHNRTGIHILCDKFVVCPVFTPNIHSLLTFFNALVIVSLLKEHS